MEWELGVVQSGSVLVGTAHHRAAYGLGQHCPVQSSMARHSPVRHSMVQQGIAWRDAAWPGSAWHSPVRPSPVQSSPVQSVVAQQSAARLSLAQHGLVCPPTPAGRRGDTQGGQTGESGGARGPSVPPAQPCPHCPSTGTLPPPPPSGPEEGPHKGPLSAGTRALCARPPVPPGSTVPGHPPRHTALVSRCHRALPPHWGFVLAAQGMSGSGDKHNRLPPPKKKYPENPNLGAATGGAPSYGQRSRNTLCA